jgi:hypothetical protein
MPQTNGYHISKKIAFLAFLAIFATNASAACEAEANWNTICPGTSFPDGVNWNKFPTTQVNGNPYIDVGCYYVADITSGPNFANGTNKKINGTDVNFSWSGDATSKIDDGYYIYVATAQNLYAVSAIVPGNNKPACADATPPLDGTATINNTSPRIGDVLTASLPGTTATGPFSYEWTAGNTTVGNNSNNYTVTLNDLGKTIKVEISADDRKGSLPSTATAAVAKKLPPSAPAAPSLASKTHNTVTLNSTVGYEYSKDGTTWQSNSKFAGLTPNTSYTFYQRIIETADTQVSGASPGLSVTTDDLDPNALLGTATISGPNDPPQINDELTASFEKDDSNDDVGTLTYTWSANDSEIAIGQTYTVLPQDFGKTITVAVTSSTKTIGEIVSEPTAAVVKIPNTTPPTALQLSNIAEAISNSITINGSNAYEYGYGTGGDITWLPVGTYTITGLSAGTSYLIYRRYTATATHTASTASGSLSVSTAMAYWITGGADNFGVRTGSAGGSFIPNSNNENNKLSKSVGTDIKNNASGNNVSITIGNGTSAVIINNEIQNVMTFDGGNWGKITLLGAGISRNNNSNDPFVVVGAGAVLTSNITNVNVANAAAFINIKESGQATIASGTIAQGTKRGVTIENNSTGSITITGGAFTGTGDAIYNQSPNASIILGGTPSIAGAIRTRVSTITALSNFNPATTVQLQFDSPVAGEIAVNGGAALAGSFSLTGTNGYALSPIDNNIYLCATTGTAITGDVDIDNTSPRIGDVLTASISNTNAGILRSYVWKANDVQVGIGQTYTVQTGDYGKTITVTISSCDKVGAKSTATNAVMKLANLHETVAPTPESITYNVITLNAINGYEYSINGTDWQDSPVFSGLNPGTQYTFYQRQKATADTETSQTSNALISTESVGDDVLLGTVTIAVSGELRVGTVLTAEFAGTNTEEATGVIYEWKVGNVTRQTSSEATYTVTFSDLGEQITVTITADNKTGDISSVPTATVQKAILTGTATISFSGDAPQVGTASATLTASIAGGNSTGVLSYVWKVNGGVQVGTGQTYMVTANDVGKRVTVTISTADQEGSVTSEQTPAVRGTNGVAAISYFLINNNENSDGNWSAHKGTYNGPAVASSSGNVQTVIEAVRADAGGADVIMHFGGDGSSRYIHSGITFSNAGPQVWGDITLQGDLFLRGNFIVITIENGVSATSSLGFEYPSNPWGTNSTPFTNRGTLTIIDGNLVKNDQTNNSIVNTGTLILSGNLTISGRIETTVGGLGVSNLTGSNTYTLNFTNAAHNAIAVLNGSDFGSRFSVANSNYSLISGGTNLLLRSGNTTPTCDAGFAWESNKCVGVFSGTVSIAGNIDEPRIGDVLTASYTGSIAPDKLRYIWKRYDAGNNSTTIASATAATYTLTVNDVGYKIAVEISADGFNGSAGSEKTEFVAKQVYVGQVIEPVPSEVTPNSITLAGISGYEYRLSEGTWQSSPEFTGLEYNREYEFYQRVAETASTEASSEAGPVAIKTSKTLLDGTVTITGNIGDTRVGDELTAQLIGGNTDELEYQWKADGENIANANNSTYTVTAGDHGKQITIVVSAAEESDYEGSKESEPTAAVKWPNIFGNAVIASNNELADPRVGDELTASLNNGPSSGLAYVWKRNGEAIGETTNEYTLAVADISAIISVEISASNYYGSVSADLGKEVEKKPAPATPAAPQLASKTNNSVTLTEVVGYKYSKDNGATWQTSNVFDGLNPNTTYAFVRRIAETEDTYASDKSAALEVTTNRNPAPDAPNAPQLASKTNNSVTLTEVAEYEYSKDNGVTWQTSNVFDGLSANTPYSFVQRIAETEDTYASNKSAALEETTDKNTVPAPAAPQFASKTNSSVSLVAVEGYEYSKDNGVNWQSSNVFSGLNPNATYSFVQRIAETEDTYASNKSAALEVTTDRNPAPDAPNAPQLASKTNSSVTLAVVEGYEYSINNGEAQSSNVFSGLSPNTQYSFRQRVAETTTTLASAWSDALEVTTDKNSAPAPVAPQLASKTNNSVTLAVVEGYEYSIDNGGTSWQTSNVFSGLNPNTEYAFVQRIAETEDTYASDKSAALEVTTNRNPAPAAPVAPTLASKTNNSVTLAVVEGYEYSINNGEAQPSNVFNGLSPNTQYSFRQRVAETTTTLASAWSDALEETTNRNPAPAAPVAPTLASKTNNSVTLVAVNGYEYSIDNGSTSWQTSNVFSGLNPNTAYAFVQRIAETEDTYASPKSAAVGVTTNRNPAPTAPVAPTLASKTNNSVTLAVVEGYEYSINNGEAQSSNVFSGLRPNTQYSFRQRVAETTTTLASAWSDALEETTNRNPAPVAPSVPTFASNTNTSITLLTVEGYEYSKDNGASWQSENTFGGLNPNASYSFVQRIAETATTYASPWSNAVSFATDRNPAPVAPSAPTFASNTNTSITLLAVNGYEYSKDNGVNWQSENTFGGLNPNASYSFVQRIAETATTYASAWSNAASFTTDRNPAPAAPNAPTLVGNVTYNSVTLVATNGYEYSKDNGATWQSSNVFGGLNPNASYSFVQRIAETATTHASPWSNALPVTTEKAPIPGIATISGASDPRVGQTLTAFLDGGPTEGLTYEWKKYTGHSFVKTVGSSATYTLIEDDVGHEFEVVIGGPNYSNYSESDKTPTVRHPDLAGSITITGNPIIGQQLGVHLVTNAVADHVYSWKIGDDEVGTEAAYTVAEDDHGQQITVTVSAAHEHQPGELTSTTTSAVAYPDLAGSITISGEARLGETLTADATGLLNTYGSLIYAWKKDGQIIGSDDTYELTVGDADYAITLTVSTDKQPAGIESTTSVVLRKVNANTTVAAQENEVTHSSIILAEIPGYEYKISGQAWQTSPEFMNLTSNTDYVFCQREAQNDEFGASEESCELTVKTLPKKDAPEAPEAPTIASKTYDSVTLVAVEGYEYSKDNGATWQSENVFGDLIPDTEYSFRQRIAETEDTYASEASSALTVTTESLPTPIGKPNFANTKIGISVSGGNLHVYTPKSVQVRIFDLKGKELLNRTIAPNEIVSIAHLPKGMYMVNVGKETFKLVR